MLLAVMSATGAWAEEEIIGTTDTGFTLSGSSTEGYKCTTTNFTITCPDKNGGKIKLAKDGSKNFNVKVNEGKNIKISSILIHYSKLKEPDEVTPNLGKCEAPDYVSYTQEWTAPTEGATSVTFTGSNTVEDININQVTIIYTQSSTSEKQNVTLSWPANMVKTVKVGSEITNAVTASPKVTGISYTSSDANIATVTENGTVHGVAAGTAKITASFAGDANYNPASTYYEVTVINTWTVSYNKNGHGVEDVPGTFSVENGYVLTSDNLPTLTEDGYTFGGWYLESSLTNKAVAGTTAITGNTTLYAQWTQNIDQNAVRRVVVFPRSKVSNFGGAAGNTTSISKNNDNADPTDTAPKILTLSTADTKVQAQGFPNGEGKPGSGFKVVNGGTFKITAEEGYKIKLIALMTGETNRSLTASPDAKAESAANDSIYRYNFANGETEVTFTNNNSNSIYVYVINVTYEYAAQEGKTPLLVEFEGNRILNGYVGDNGVVLPKHTIKTNDGTVVTEGYKLKYVSNNTKIVEVPNEYNNSLNLKTEGTAAVTVVIEPTDAQYEGGSGVVTVVSRPLPKLTVNAADILMNSNLLQQKEPSVNVWLNGKKLKSNEYMLTFTKKEDENNIVSISNEKPFVNINRTDAYNYKTGTATITVTATPTADYADENHCQAGSENFSFTVKPAGEQRTPTIDVPTEVTFATGQTKTIEPRIVYDGSDITARFENFKCSVTEAGSSVGASAQMKDVTENKINRKYCEIKTGSAPTTTVSGNEKTKNPFVVTITATPKKDYSDQYISPVTQTIKVNVENVATYKQLTIAGIDDLHGKVGEELNLPALNVTSGNNPISLEDMNVEVTSTAAQVVVRDLGRKNFTLLCAEMDTVTVRVRVSSKDDIAEKYEDAITRFRVIVTDDKVYKVEQKPVVNGTTVELPDITMTYGGWVFTEDYKTRLEKTFGSKEKIWCKKKNGEVKYTDDAGSPKNFTYLIDGSSHENPRDELGANCAPNGTTVDYNGKDFKFIDNMFSVPAEGAYLIFAPKVNGRVTAHVLQDGVFNWDNGKNEVGYSPNRRVFVIDESGKRMEDDDIAAFIDVTTQTMPKKEVNKVKTPVTDITQYGKDPGWQPSIDFDCPDDLFTYNNNNVTNFVNNLYKRKCNSENDKLVGGYIVLTKAPVTYSFDVKAGKTYYLYCFGSKLSLYGYEFKPADDVKEYEVTFKEKYEKDEAIPTIDASEEKQKEMAKVTIERVFKSGIWNSCVLPFSLNKQQVDAIFGQTRDKTCTNGTEILYFDHVDKSTSTIHFVRHAYNTIVAGKPFLIKPTKENAKICPENMGDSPYVTIESATAEKFGKDKETADWYWQGSYTPFDISKGSYVIRDYAVDGTSADGRIVCYTPDASLEIKGFRGYLTTKDKSIAATAKPMTVAFSDFESGETTYIDNVEIGEDGTLREGMSGKIYNLHGQMVRSNASQLNTLPKGIYIVNGTKVSVK